MQGMLAEHILANAGREVHALKDLADKAIAQLDDDAFFARLGPESNSIPIVMKHLVGNMRSRWTDFLTSDGEKPDRNRDREFRLEPQDTRAALGERWEAAWGLVFDALAGLGPADLEATVHVRGERLSVLQAIQRQMTHYSYHVGQIVLLAKHARASAWRTLSIPPGGSAAFDARVREWHGDAPRQG